MRLSSAYKKPKFIQRTEGRSSTRRCRRKRDDALTHHMNMTSSSIPTKAPLSWYLRLQSTYWGVDSLLCIACFLKCVSWTAPSNLSEQISPPRLLDITSGVMTYLVIFDLPWTVRTPSLGDSLIPERSMSGVTGVLNESGVIVFHTQSCSNSHC